MRKRIAVLASIPALLTGITLPAFAQIRIERIKSPLDRFQGRILEAKPRSYDWLSGLDFGTRSGVALEIDRVLLVETAGSVVRVTARTFDGTRVSILVGSGSYQNYPRVAAPSSICVNLVHRCVREYQSDALLEVFQSLSFARLEQSLLSSSVYVFAAGSETLLSTQAQWHTRARSAPSRTLSGALVGISIRDNAWHFLQATLQKSNGSRRFVHLLRASRSGELPGRPVEVASLAPLSEAQATNFLDVLLASRGIVIDDRCLVDVSIQGLGGAKAVFDAGSGTRWM